MPSFKQLAVDNLAITAFVAFFIFVGTVKTLASGGYKVDLPVKFDPDSQFTAREKQLVRESLRWQLIAWQDDSNCYCDEGTVIVKRNLFRDKDVANGVLLSGLCVKRTKTITVYAGQYMEVPSFYHELCHLNSDNTDINHADPRWPQWEARNEELCLFLIRGRTK